MSPELDCGSDAGAYVLGAMDAEEAAAFERHLSECSACREEVATLKDAAGALPLMVPQMELPRSLRRRVMSEVRADARARRVGGASDGAPPRWRGLGRLTLTPGSASALAGVVAVAAAVVVAVVISIGSSAGRTVRAHVAFAGGRANVRLQSGHGELIVTGMPAPPTGKIYEVWIKRGAGAPQPTDALFDVTRAGRAAVAVPGSLRGVSAVMVTAERDGGSRVPHGPILIDAKLA